MSTDQEILDELKKISRSTRSSQTRPQHTPPKGLWNEFKDFLSKYKVLGLAVAFIIGLYLGGLVQALIKDLLLPAIGLAMTSMACHST